MRWILSVVCSLVVIGSCCAEDVAPGNPELAKAQKFIHQLEGAWDAKVTFMGNSDPTFAMTGVENNSVGAGGNWLISDFSSERYHGHGVYGFDQTANQFSSAWVDSMKPSIAATQGSLNSSENVLTLQSLAADKTVRCRITIEIKDSNTRVSTYFGAGADGKEFPYMTITYKRKS